MPTKLSSMKTHSLLLAVIASILCISSCKKDKNEVPETKGIVEYIIRCEDCTATFDVAAGKRNVKIQGEASILDKNELSDITVTTVGKGDSEVNIKIDEISVYFALKNMNLTGNAVHNVKVKR